MKTLLLITSIILIGCQSNEREPDNKQGSISKTTDTIGTQLDSISEKKLKQAALFVFVGEKLEVFLDSTAKHQFDSKFIARYRVIKKVFGEFEFDTISFTAYDHYGYPYFAQFENALLYVSKVNKEHFHFKYLFNDVYLTKSGKWASPYWASGYNHTFNKNIHIKPEKIEFFKPISYDLRNYYHENIPLFFPEKYYIIKDSIATTVWGNYIPELFELMKNGVLSARCVF